ncbi:class I SAM-dependent methyltransferase [Clostridium sp. WILCCON 0269]|uniref:S-adenosyl-L-methionine-dependent methyltransferase n=1 Tax=Candidatus Clostridium eludens TaxID=3381663 RepID=A0ABW8SG93_9CLOT
MKKNQSSRSAEGVALMRALEAQKPENERICYDPYAYAFVPDGILYSFFKKIINSNIYDCLAPGAKEFVVGRERYIDDFLISVLDEGLEQVVILGAGFDTRAYRIPGIEKTRVFEIDHPATQKVKLQRLRKVIDPLPEYVTFTSVDFNTQQLGERLQSSSYNKKGKTLFIWQGVTYFLTKEGVDSTLAFIANHSGPGSAVIFDYFYNETLHDTHSIEVKMMQRTARMAGEGYLFGVDQGQIEQFLIQRGFHDILNTELKDIKQLYFTGPNAGHKIAEGIAVVSARVNYVGD